MLVLYYHGSSVALMEGNVSQMFTEISQQLLCCILAIALSFYGERGDCIWTIGWR